MKDTENKSLVSIWFDLPDEFNIEKVQYDAIFNSINIMVGLPYSKVEKKSKDIVSMIKISTKKF